MRHESAGLTGYLEGFCMDWEKLQKKFEGLPSGEKLMCADGDYWIKPVQDISHHLDHKVINLFSGKIVHFSRLKQITPVYGSEIRW